jgi:hypothetical protein
LKRWTAQVPPRLFGSEYDHIRAVGFSRPANPCGVCLNLNSEPAKQPIAGTSLHILACNLKRLVAILGVPAMITAIQT